MNDRWSNYNYTLNKQESLIHPNAAFGNVYWVDKSTGSDSNDGLTPASAFLTIANAISVSNAEVGSYDMNTIYVNSNTYTESLTTGPKQCNIIGIGAKVRLQGVQAFASASNNWHFWNIQFRYSTGTLFTIPSTSYGVGFHGCTFDNTGATIGISVGATQDFICEDCRFIGNPIFTTAITSTARQIRLLIRNNIIAATTNGILIAAADDGYFNVIKDNVIGRMFADPNSSSQGTYGIRLAKTTGTSKYQIVGNQISAADAISSATADTAIQIQCIGNRVSEAGTSAWEDA